MTHQGGRAQRIGRRQHQARIALPGNLSYLLQHAGLPCSLPSRVWPVPCTRQDIISAGQDANTFDPALKVYCVHPVNAFMQFLEASATLQHAQLQHGLVQGSKVSGTHLGCERRWGQARGTG